jgi:hypothetical protein
MQEIAVADIIQELEGPLPPRVLKVLAAAECGGWTENPYVSLAVRYTHPEGQPFFARWDLFVSGEGKHSWRFAGARANNGQSLNYNDILTYLGDPSVIYPEPPADTTPVTEADCA